MSSPDGEGPGQKPKPPAPSRAPLPPPKAPPGGRPHSPSTAPAVRREGSAVTPMPQPAAPSPASGPHAAPSPATGPHAAPSPATGPHAAPSPTPLGGSPVEPSPTPLADFPVAPAPSLTPLGGLPVAPPGPQAPPAGPPQHTAPLAFPPAAASSHAAHVAAQHQPAFVSPPGAAPGSIVTTQPQFGAIARPEPSPAAQVSGVLFVNFLKITARRAFRVRVQPAEVLPTERAALERGTPLILDTSLQAFLAWRRSVLFLVALALVPLSIISLVDALVASMPAAIRLVKLGPALADALFCWLCWAQLKRWSQWRQQRRMLLWGWLLFMGMPFLVFLYPLRTVLVETASSGAAASPATYERAVQPFLFAMIAMLQIAPKAISLMPGLVRASLVVKRLFPGSAAPGWLIVLCSPLYALLAYVVLIIPYQYTGSGWFIAGMLTLIAGQILFARAGASLAHPLSEDEALRRIQLARAYPLAVMILSGILMVIALSRLVALLDMRVTDLITAVMKFETNVLILTLIGADLIVTNLARARAHAFAQAHGADPDAARLAAFASLDAPAPPPLSDPAP